MKKIIVVLFIASIFLSIGSASAQETNNTQATIENNIGIESPNLENNVKEERKTLDDLKILIENSSDNSIINLNNDYTYNESVDFNGIEIKSSNVTIDGNGHTIASKSTNNVRIFNITGSNITLKNLIFTNSKHEYGGAIYNTGHNISIINSTFINNTALEKGGAIYNEMEITISNSKFVDNTSPEGTIYNDCVLNYDIETFNDLQNAINIISGTINLNSNITMTNNEASKFRNGIVVNKSINIDCGQYTINGNNLGRIFNITKNATLNINDGNLVNGIADIGGAIYNDGNLITMRVNLVNNTATKYGGAIFNNNTTTIYLSNFNSNNIINRELSSSGEYYGGSAIYNWYDGTLLMTGSNIYNNLKNYNNGDLVSGAITSIGNAQIISCFFNNNSGYFGGAISALGNLVSSYKVLSISNSEFSENNAVTGGGIYGNGTLFLINNCEFNNNTGYEGGAINVGTSNQYVVGVINNTEFLNNKAQFGGALWLTEGEYTLLNSSFINNSAYVAGAIGFTNAYYSQTSKINDCNFENNTASNSAAAIYNNNTLNLQDSTFINNTSPNGTFTNFGNMNLHITTFTELEKIINDFSGILTLHSNIKMSEEEAMKFVNGINIKKDIIIDGKNLATINANNLTRIFNIAEGCNVTLANIELINGKADIGGAIYNNGNLTIYNSTIYNNTANEGSAVYNNEGNVIVDYNWWGINNPNWSKLLKNIDNPNVFATLNLTTELDKNNDCYITLTLYQNNTDIIASIPPCYATITVGNYSTNILVDVEESYHVSAGNTTIFASLHNQIVNTTINAPKITPKITIYANNIHYGENLFIIIILPEYVTGNVTVTINNTNYTQNITNRKVMLNIGNLSSDNYTITAKYNGDENYLTNEISKNITVYKANPNLVVNINNTSYNEKFIINATLIGINEIGLNTTINVNINGENYSVAIINGTGVLIGDKLNAGEYNFTAKWSGDENYNNITFNGSFKVNKTTTDFNITYNITEGANGTIVITLASDAKGYVTFTLDGKNYTSNIENGTSTIILSKLSKGNYTGIVSYSGDDNYLPQTIAINFTVLENKTTYLDANDLIMIYHDGSKFIAKLLDFNKNPIANATISIEVNNVTYKRVSDDKGLVYLTINLNSGNYPIIVKFNGNDAYDSCSINKSVFVNSTIIANDIVKMYCNDTQFIAKFSDYNGKLLANTNFTFNINGVFYTKTSDENGTTKLNINLRPGNYIITSYNNVTGEEKSFNITVNSLIESDDLTKYYQNESQFVVKVYDKSGKLAINKTVQFNINGMFYTKTTNDKGIANLNINLNPGNYQITTIVDGLNIGSNICVLPTLITKDLTTNYLDNSKFNATTLDNQGNPLANQTVKFNINGVIYNKITNNDGIASLNINLIAGKYIITSYWRDYEIGNIVTING